MMRTSPASAARGCRLSRQMATALTIAVATTSPRASARPCVWVKLRPATRNRGVTIWKYAGPYCEYTSS